jgi:hypothetical protein
MQTRKRAAPLETNHPPELKGAESSYKVARRDANASTTQDTFHQRLQVASAVLLRDNRSLHLLQILRNLTLDSPVDDLQKQWVIVLRTIQDAAREPTFGLNMSWSDESSNILFFKFMQLYYYFLPNDEEPPEPATKRASLLTAFVACYHAYESKLLTTFTPTLRGPNHTTIIHCAIEHMTLRCNGESFMRDFVRSMIRHGVPADAQNAEGQSYLHEQVRVGSILKLDGMLALGFLHEYGVPFNLQRDNGNTMLHDLVFYLRLADLRAVCAHRDSYHLDYWVENKAGQTPIELAQFLHDNDEEEEDRESRMEIIETLRLNASLWKQHIQPIICETIPNSTWLIPDVAHIIANYLA